MRKVPEEQRFWEKVNKNAANGCWEWTASRSFGYGKFRRTGSRKMTKAHRVSYELATGSIIPDGMVIDHLCLNKLCVNPNHLEVVTPRENTIRGNSLIASNAAKTHCPQGHEYTPENTFYRHPERNMGRQCRECRKRYNPIQAVLVRRRYYARKLARLIHPVILRQICLDAYFRDYEQAMRDPEQLMHDPDEMKKRSVELNISAKEWAAHYNRQKAKAAGAF